MNNRSESVLGIAMLEHSNMSLKTNEDFKCFYKLHSNMYICVISTYKLKGDLFSPRSKSVNHF